MARKSQSPENYRAQFRSHFSAPCINHTAPGLKPWGAVMSEHLQVVFDVVTRMVSYRYTWRERPAVTLLEHPALLQMPASVLCARQEGRLDAGHVANTAQPPCSTRSVMYLSQMPEVSVCEA